MFWWTVAGLGMFIWGFYSLFLQSPSGFKYRAGKDIGKPMTKSDYFAARYFWPPQIVFAGLAMMPLGIAAFFPGRDVVTLVIAGYFLGLGMLLTAGGLLLFLSPPFNNFFWHYVPKNEEFDSDKKHMGTVLLCLASGCGFTAYLFYSGYLTATG
ncbi:hypothetical protein HYW59_01690 [Candidatus Kaiserbacteria bacterium]|nr:hypothetical protein [Candidatus Kaiserbacteria bacterium]